MDRQKVKELEEKLRKINRPYERPKELTPLLKQLIDQDDQKRTSSWEYDYCRS